VAIHPASTASFLTSASVLTSTSGGRLSSPWSGQIGTFGPEDPEVVSADSFVMTETLSLFFALLALSGAVAVVGILVAQLGRFGSRSMQSPASLLLDSIAPAAILLAFLAAATAMAGSLYYSEVAGYDPCRLCWVQRGFMYPSALILGVATWLQRPRLSWVAFALSIPGLAVAGFHRAEQQLPESIGGVCAVDNPCSSRYVDEFGFVTIPTMAAVGFALLLVLIPLAFRSQRLEPEDANRLACGSTRAEDYV
jgi:disulfide bond formation protein DsbB